MVFTGRLPDRAIVRATGKDVHGFLQGLFSNDVRRLQPGGSMYGCFMNKNGRVMFDAILMQSEKQYQGQSAVYIEVDRSVSAVVADHLKEYRLRRKIAIDDLAGKLAVVATTDGNLGSDTSVAAAIDDATRLEAFPDPRNPILLSTSTELKLRRMIVPQEWSPNQAFRNPAEYDGLLLSSGLYEGPAVFTKDKSLPFEGNLDMCDGVSFNKGCYLGQELTHRTHVMLVTRKRTVPLTLGVDPSAPYFTEASSNPIAASELEETWGPTGTPLYHVADDGVTTTKVGVLLAKRCNKAVGLVRLRYFDPAVRQLRVRVGSPAADAVQAVASIPSWWDKETADKIFRKDESGSGSD